MSDEATCENCDKVGRRIRGTFAPAGWLFLEAKIDEEDEDTLIIWVCSRKCADTLWRTGPGQLDMQAEYLPETSQVEEFCEKLLTLIIHNSSEEQFSRFLKRAERKVLR